MGVSIHKRIPDTVPYLILVTMATQFNAYI
jgi:hypothetical protein